MEGERRAARWYEDRGYEIVDRNWRGPGGEIDLVVKKGSTLVFCEVKTRSGLAFGSPFEAVTGPKQARIRRLASAWLRQHRSGQPGRGPDQIRFDVASVMHGEVDVIEAAF